MCNFSIIANVGYYFISIKSFFYCHPFVTWSVLKLFEFFEFFFSVFFSRFSFDQDLYPYLSQITVREICPDRAFYIRGGGGVTYAWKKSPLGFKHTGFFFSHSSKGALMLCTTLESEGNLCHNDTGWVSSIPLC